MGIIIEEGIAKGTSMEAGGIPIEGIMVVCARPLPARKRAEARMVLKYIAEDREGCSESF